MIKKYLIEKIKYVVFNFTWLGKPRYPYNICPMHLSSMVLDLDASKSYKGGILEIGVARGMTTMFLNEYLSNIGSVDPYYALDTFTSFDNDDINYEVKTWKKRKIDLIGFQYITYNAWIKNFKNYLNVKPIKCDCKNFDYKILGKLKLCFIDVDLYLPTLFALRGVYDQLIPGGVIYVDDVIIGKEYDGAGKALFQFCVEKKITFEKIGIKSARIYKQIN